MNEHQRTLLDLLNKTDSLFRKHGITYYLSGGGALGAVRHRGYLPWDDDIDLYLFRSEYEKVQAIRGELEENGLVLCDSHYFKWYDDTLVRLSATDNAMLTKSRMVDETPNGYYMEIFVLDPIPRDPVAKKEWLRKHWLYAEVLKDAYIISNTRVHEYTDEDMYFEYRRRFRKENREDVLAELEEELFSIDMEDADECCSRWGMRAAVYNIDWFGEPKYLPFEDTMVPVPSQVEKFLRADFGDSWVMIPQGTDAGTWHNIASSTHISYKAFVDDYMQFLDADKIHKTYQPRKRNRMRKYFNDKRAIEELQTMKKALIALHYKEFHVEPDTLKEWADTERYDRIEEYFELWRRIQFSRIFTALGTYADIGDEYLYYALLPMIRNGEYSAARSVLEWRMRSGQIEGGLRNEFEYLKNIGDAYEAIYENDLQGASAYFSEAQKYGFEIDRFNQAYLSLYLRIHGGMKTEDIPGDRGELEQLISDFPERPEPRCLLADLEYDAGNQAKAEVLYEQAQQNNYNGMLLLHISDRLVELQAKTKGENRG